jgi:hypothetical protein
MFDSRKGRVLLLVIKLEWTLGPFTSHPQHLKCNTAPEGWICHVTSIQCVSYESAEICLHIPHTLPCRGTLFTGKHPLCVHCAQNTKLITTLPVRMIVYSTVSTKYVITINLIRTQGTIYSGTVNYFVCTMTNSATVDLHVKLNEHNSY